MVNWLVDARLEIAPPSTAKINGLNLCREALFPTKNLTESRRLFIYIKSRLQPAIINEEGTKGFNL